VGRSTGNEYINTQQQYKRTLTPTTQTIRNTQKIIRE